MYLYPSVYKRPHPQGNLYMQTHEELEKIAFELETIGLIHVDRQSAIEGAQQVEKDLRAGKQRGPLDGEPLSFLTCGLSVC